ncbi:MAG: galactokinase [Firmicutes bacterium]|nr:galactokinase [Bacillota bacterium]
MPETQVWRTAWPQFQAFSPRSIDDVRVFFAPGRVNLIGEHTDYNGGYVLPAALTLGTWVFVRARSDGWLRFASTLFTEQISCRTDDLVYRAQDGFANYPKGALWALGQLGMSVPGADFFFAGNLPHRAGLSSSASIEMATAVAANALSDGQYDRTALVTAAKRAENEFLGVSSGIMDQFAVAMGERDRALLLDCATLAYETVPLKLEDYQFVIMNTCYQRGLAESKYNERFAQCQQALKDLQHEVSGLQYLGQISELQWGEVADAIADPVIRGRARHVILENDRTLRAAKVWKSGDARGFGQLMNESHESLRDDYEVTGHALDAIVEAAWQAPGCVGARMTGAGFGGCAVALVERSRTEPFISSVIRDYKSATGLDGQCYLAEIGDGAREVTDEVKAWL